MPGCSLRACARTCSSAARRRRRREGELRLVALAVALRLRVLVPAAVAVENGEAASELVMRGTVAQAGRDAWPPPHRESCVGGRCGVAHGASESGPRPS